MANILIVDDEVLIAPLISDCLERFGHRTRIARSAVGALGWMDLEEFDLVVLDIMMAGPLDGLDLCGAIRSDPRKAMSKILMISGVHDMEENALRAGADAFLPKPFDLMEIINSVSDLLEVRRGEWTTRRGHSIRQMIHSYNA